MNIDHATTDLSNDVLESRRIDGAPNQHAVLVNGERIGSARGLQ